MVYSNVTDEPLRFRTDTIPGGDTRLLFIHGYGGNMEQPGVRWMMNRFLEAGFTVTYIQLPTVIEDFGEEILKPATDVQNSIGDHVLAGFSLGGLTAAYLKGAKKRVFLSPFWGINERWDFRGLGHVLSLLSGLNLPQLKRQFDTEDAGPLAREEDLNGVPEQVDPRTINEMHNAQKNLPPPMPGDVVFYSERDRIISQKKVRERGIRTHRFRGGHMFYLSRDRKRIMETIISELSGIPVQTHSAI